MTRLFTIGDEGVTLAELIETSEGRA